MGRLIITGLLLLLVVKTHCSVMMHSGAFLLPDSALVAMVNGEAVTKIEFMLHARTLKPLVINDFRSAQVTEFGNDFWSRKFDGKTPMEALKKRTLDTIVQIKVQQISARNAGIVADISYSGFLNALETENHRRLVAKKSGEVIYGPVQYSEEVFYNYLFSNMVYRFRENLAGSVFRITDEKLKEAYEKDKDSLYRKGYHTVAVLIKLKPGQGVTCDESEKMMPQAETTLVFNDSVYAPEEDDVIRSMVKEASRKLAKGQCSEIIGFQGARYVVMVKEKSPLGYRSFENCRTAVRILMLDRMYEQYIHGMAEEATCETNMDVYEKIQF